MKIGLISAEFINNDIKHNLNKIKKHLDLAHKDDIDMIFFGEGFLQGFDGLKWVFNEDKFIALSKESDVIKDIIAKVKNINVGIGFGYYEYFDDSIYCSYLVLDKSGNILCNYRRMSEGWKIPGLPPQYKEGTEIGQFEFDNKSFKLALCGDLWDDSILNKYNELDKDISLWPLYTNFDLYKDMDNYINRVVDSGSNVFIINSLSKIPESQGGSYHIKNGTLYNKTEINKESRLVVKI